MNEPVVVGVDGSGSGLAAVRWALAGLRLDELQGLLDFPSRCGCRT